MKTIRINPKDNVQVVLQDGGSVPHGHKLALKDIAAGESIIKYGVPIGLATASIAAGEWVHTHNMRTGLAPQASYEYHPQFTPLQPAPPQSFMGYRRAGGRVGVRNELWIIPTVGCVNSVALRAVQQNSALVQGNIDGLFAYTHPFGCSQMGDDHEQTKRLLAALAHHPNAGGVLVLGLGCENNTMQQFQQALGSWDDDRVKFLVCQQSEDELADCAQLLGQLAEYAQGFERSPVPVSELVVGMKCGGSDGLSGITANPVVGGFSDMLIAQGGSTILTEVPEMFGAEQMLMDRCADKAVFDKTVQMINGFKAYFTAHGQVVYENPSPGNKDGGITTLEDKSCGCVQKGGTAPVVDVIEYGRQVQEKGLTLLNGPGNDIVSTTALTAAGAHIILFTTGRGTPIGAPVPTIKIASNSALFAHKSSWMDFDAGPVADGESIEHAAKRLFELVTETAGGKPARNEVNGYREISIFKEGVVL